MSNMTSDCLFYLPVIHVPKSKKVSVTVLHAQIPSAYYNINSSNDQLTYTINTTSLLKKTVYLAHSNYNITSLITHIKTLIEADFNIIYSSSSNKLTISHGLYEFELNNESTCFELLGFSHVNHLSTTKILISDNVVNLFTVRTLQIASDNFILNNIDSFNPNNSNILASIPVTSSYNSIISYSNIHNVHSEINNTRNLTNLHLKITDQDGNTIDLNNSHWSLTLMLTIK
jgi:hypothetical protein